MKLRRGNRIKVREGATLVECPEAREDRCAECRAVRIWKVVFRAAGRVMEAPRVARVLSAPACPTTFET